MAARALKRRGDHVRMGGHETGDMLFECRHCGDTYLLRLPCGLRLAAAAGKAYLQDHRGCRPSAEMVKAARFDFVSLLVTRCFQRGMLPDGTIVQTPEEP